MDLKYGSSAREAFVSNVGLITSNGPQGHNIMAAEWTDQVSYDPGLVTVSVGMNKATRENITALQCFGVVIAAEDQNVLSSLSGAFTGKKVDKIGWLQELGFTFHKAEQFDLWLPDGGVLTLECKVVDHKVQGDHEVFVGHALSVRFDAAKKPLVYHQGKYWKVGEAVEKPSPEERERMNALAERYRRE